MKKDTSKASRLKIGTICAIIVSFCYTAIVILALFSPKSIISYQATEQYFLDFKHYKDLFIALKILMAIANAAMIGVVISIYKLKPKKHHNQLAFFSVLAFIGLGIGMLQSIEDATQVPHIAKSYEQADQATRVVILAFGVANPAIYSLSLGLTGLWFIVISFIYRNIFSKPLVFFGVLWGIGNILTVIAHLFIFTWLIYFIEAGALLGAPAWGFLQSRFLWQAHKNKN